MEMSVNPPFRGTRAYIGLGTTSAIRSHAAFRRSPLAGLGAVAATSAGLRDRPGRAGASDLGSSTPCWHWIRRSNREDLLDALLAIEADFKRVRGVRFGPARSTSTCSGTKARGSTASG